MARYLDRSGTKYWEIERDGATIVRRAGTVGSAGRTQQRTYANALVARYHHALAVAHKLADEHYRDVTPVDTHADAFPPDDEGRLVEGDRLQQLGDPLGELIALQHAGLDTTALVDAHAARWFGGLADARALLHCEWRLGRLARVRIGAERAGGKAWRALVDAVFVDVPLAFRLGTLVAALCELPIARALEALELGSVGTPDYAHAITAIVAHAPPTLRTLAIHGEAKGVTSEGHIAALRLPALETLVLDINLGTQGLAHLLAAELPALRALTFVLCGSHDAQPEEVPGAIESLAPLLRGDVLPTVRRLVIWTPAPTPLCAALVQTPRRFDEVIVHSKRPLERTIHAALPAFVHFDQQPAYTLRR